MAAATFSRAHAVGRLQGQQPASTAFNTYDLDVSEGGNFLPTYTKIGCNADEVVITFNMYPDHGYYFHVQVLSFAASSIFSASPPPTLTLGTDYFSSDRYNNDFTMAPASMHGATAGMPMYFVEENSFDNGSQMRRRLGRQPAEQLAELHRHRRQRRSLHLSALRSATRMAPSRPTTPGSSTPTGATACWSPTRTSASTPTATSHARWYEFNVTGSPYLVQDGTITPGPGTSTYFPAIAIAPGDVIGMVYNESSPNEYPSVYDTGRTSAIRRARWRPRPWPRPEPRRTPISPSAGAITAASASTPATARFWSGAEYSTSLLSG